MSCTPWAVFYAWMEKKKGMFYVPERLMYPYTYTYVHTYVEELC